MAKYFRENRTPAKYKIGDRVRGFWNGVPFSGSVAVDHIVYENVGPTVSIFLDLPIMHEDKSYNIITVGYQDLLDTKEKYDIKSKTNRKKSVVDRN